MTVTDASDPLYARLGSDFIHEYVAEFGTDHVYNCDAFNEMRPRSDDPGFLAKHARAVYSVRVKEMPDVACWVQLYHDTHVRPN